MQAAAFAAGVEHDGAESALSTADGCIALDLDIGCEIRHGNGECIDAVIGFAEMAPVHRRVEDGAKLGDILDFTGARAAIRAVRGYPCFAAGTLPKLWPSLATIDEDLSIPG